jgi:pimeloyl-ACP methyl ester carboxylesterase
MAVGLHRVPKLLAAVFVLVALAAPPVRSFVKGALLVPEVIPSLVHPLSLITPRPHRNLVHLPGTDADLYRPRGFTAAPGIILVHGANPDGKDDSRIVRLAQSLARDGRRVLVPQLGLRNQRLDLADPGRIRDAVSYLAGVAPGRVGILAFSYGAGLTLVALAQQPEIQGRVAFVATVGTYYSLFDILQGVTTHTQQYADRITPWQPDPQALQIAAEQLADFLGGVDGQALTRAWNSRDPTGLGAGPRAAYELLANRDPARFATLAGQLPQGIQSLLRELSPATSLDRITVPVLALHARTDPASPPTESRLLVHFLPGRVKTRLVIVGNLSHVSPTVSVFGDVADAFRLAGFGQSALRAQEGWPRP